MREDPKEKAKKFEFMTQKHSKKDYDSIKKMTVTEIFDAYSLEQKKVKYDEGGNDFKDIIKIEKKKKRLA